MTTPVQRRRFTRRPRLSPRRSFKGLWLLCGVLYATAGLLITGLTEVPWVPWVWALAALGVLLQAALAGPTALQRFRWLTASLMALASIGGSGALAVALAIALNHLGTDSLDELTLGQAAVEVMLYSGLAVGLAALCSLATAALGDRLLHRHGGPRASGILVVTGLLGLVAGGALGLALSQGVGLS